MSLPGTFQTCGGSPTMSVHRGKADLATARSLAFSDRFLTQTGSPLGTLLQSQSGPKTRSRVRLRLRKRETERDDTNSAGKGDAPRVRTCREFPQPSKSELRSSRPRKQGEGARLVTPYRAAITMISTPYCGAASPASTVARAGVLPADTQPSHTAFISGKVFMSGR